MSAPSWSANDGGGFGHIGWRTVFGGNILKQPGYQGIAMRQVGSLEQTDRIMRDTFFIGVYPGLTDEMITYVLGTFQAFFASGRGPGH